MTFLNGSMPKALPIQFIRLALIAVALSGILSGHASADEQNFSGHYELAEGKSTRSFSLDIKQTRDRAEIAFSAAMADGSGAAPDATGTGHVDDGTLSFKFKDSFNNEGTATLTSKKDGYHLSLTVTKVVDVSPLHFYGNMLLKPTAGKDDSDLPTAK